MRPAAWLGRLDVLVNNAGMVRRCAAIDVEIEDWDAVINLNLRSAFLLAQTVARRYLKQGSGGKIINIASLLSFQGGVFVPAYAASKSALMGLTKALANEWAAHGVNVNAIAPGYIETQLTGPLRNDEKRYAEILARIPAGRWGGPTKWRARRCSLRRRQATTCTATRWPSTAAGSRVSAPHPQQHFANGSRLDAHGAGVLTFRIGTLALPKYRW